MFLNERGQTFREVMPLAMCNLAIAQNRDREQYRRVLTGSGSDRPKVSFKVGDYVLVGRRTKGTLDIATHPGVLQVSEVRNAGVMELIRSDGVRITEQVKNVAHCPVPVLDPVVDTGLVERVGPIHCQHCGRRSGEAKVVLCDVCNVGNHIWCLMPPLETFLRVA